MPCNTSKDVRFCIFERLGVGEVAMLRDMVARSLGMIGWRGELDKTVSRCCTCAC